MRDLVVKSLLLVAALLAATAGGLRAEEFPTRPVTLIVPWPAGGATDAEIRALAAATEKHLGQRILVENKPGFSGTLAPIRMAEMESPDGYTISQIPISVLRAPFVMKTTFDPRTDLTYIIHVSGYVFGVVVRTDAPWKTFDDLVADARANPGKITYGTSGAGSTPHLVMERIARQQGIKWTHVPFKGVAETNTALLGGHIDAAADGSGWAPLVDAQRFRLLVTWGTERSKKWPTAPTLTETGIDIVAESPYGIAGPKGMDPAVVRILHDAFRKGIDDPSHLAVLARLDQKPFYLGSREYRDFALHQIEEQRRLVEDLGRKLD